jgi:hypothetical protein
MFGAGSKFFGGNTPNNGTGTVTGANNGVRDASNIVQLGQPIGTVGDPAKLLHDTEIPDVGSFRLYLGRNNGVDNAILFSPDLGISIGNNTGNGFSAEWTVGVNNCDLNIHTDDGQEILFDFDAATDSLIYNATSDGARRRLLLTTAFIPTGFGSAVAHISATLVLALTKNNSLLLCDTSTGNLVVNMDPTLFPGQEFDIKKTSADLNSVTLTPLSGTIQGFGAPAATYSFNTQGESIRVKTDGVNFYII